MVARPHGVTPTQTQYPHCTRPEHCRQAHCDLDDYRAMLDAADRVIDGRDRAIEAVTSEAERRIERAREILAARGPRRVEAALAVLSGSGTTGNHP